MDRECFVREIEKVSGTLYRVSYAILQNNEDCRDAMQEAALRAWEKRGSLREPAHFGTWITRILINESRNIQRKRRGLVCLDSIQEPAAEAPDPTLSMILQAMPERLRLPLMLQYAEGMSYEQIAKVLRLPLSTVRGRIYRAKQHLRKELEA